MSLSDDSLKFRLKEAGIDHGPINDSTRHLYLNLLKKKETNPIDFKKPSVKKLSMKKQQQQASASLAAREKSSPPKSPPNLSTHCKPQRLKRHASDTKGDNSFGRSVKKLKRCTSDGASAPEIFLQSNGHSNASVKRTSERAYRLKARQASQESDVSTSSTVDTDGSQSLTIDDVAPIDRNTRVLSSIPEVQAPLNGLKMDPKDSLFNSPPHLPTPSFSPSFHSPLVNGMDQSPAPFALPKPFNSKIFNGQPASPQINFVSRANSSFSNGSVLSRPLLHDPKQWRGWVCGERRQDWELNPECLTICKTAKDKDWRLGIGGYCEVYKGMMYDVDDVAVKVCRVLRKESIDLFKQEIELISKLHHRNILQFYGACVTSSNIFMVTELMEVDLFTALKKDSSVRWKGQHGQSIARDIALGMNYLHKRNPTVVHRDLKSSNVLLHRYIAKIGDVGIARLMTQDNMTAQSSFTLAWAAPEVIYRQRATEKIDIWSFGIILWEIVTGKTPQTGYLSMPYWCPENVKSLYIRCIYEDQSLRPTAGEIVKSIDDMNENQ